MTSWLFHVNRRAYALSGLLVVAICTLALTRSLDAATIDWSSTAITNAWATGGNWDGAIAPANDLTTDIARFDKTSYLTQPNSGTLRSISGLQIGDGGAATAVLTLTNTALSLGSSGITMFANAGAATLTGGSVKIGANQTWANNSSSLFTISSNITNIGNTAPFTLTLNGSGSGGMTLGGVISNGGSTGTTAVTVNRTGGVTTLSGVNTFTGALSVQAGTLSIASINNASANGVLGNSASAVVLGGSGTTGTLQFTGATASSTRKFTLATGGAGVFQIDSSATALTLSGIIDGGGNLTKTGAGELDLRGVNTYGGDTTISAGTLTLGAAGVIPDGAGKGNLIVNGTLDMGKFDETINGLSGSGVIDNTSQGGPGGADDTLTVGNNNASSTFSGVLQDSGGRKLLLTKVGTGTLTLSGASTYDGNTAVSAGVLNIQNASALGATTAGTTVSNGAALQIQGGIAVGAEALTLNGSGIASDGALRNISASNSWSGNLTIGSATTFGSDSGSLTLSAAFTNAGFLLTTTGAGNLTFSGVISGAGGLTKNGAGTHTLSAANTYTGATTVNGGTLTVSAPSGSALGATSAVTVNSSGTLALGASNQVNNSASLTLAGGTFAKGNFSEGSATSAGLNALNLTAPGATIDFGAGTAGTLAFAIFNPGSDSLIIDNWTGTANTIGNAITDRLVFGTDQTANLSNFLFSGYEGATSLSLGGGFFEVTPLSAVPEINPAFAAPALCALFAIFVYWRPERASRRASPLGDC